MGSGRSRRRRGVHGGRAAERSSAAPGTPSAAGRGSILRAGAAAVGWIALAALIGACGGEAPAPPGELRSYEVDALVRWVAPPGAEPREIEIRHEAIPTFVGIDGEVVGMEAMTMRFPLAGEAADAAVAPGDEVRFTLEVDWEGSPPARVTAIGAVGEAAAGDG